MARTSTKMARPKSAYTKQWRTLCDLAHRRNAAEGLFGVEFLFCVLLCALLLLMPAMVIREIGGRLGYMPRKLAIEAWAIARPIGLTLILWRFPNWGAAPWVAGVALLDLYLYLFGLLFLSRFYTPPASAGRSLLLLGVNFIDFVLSFALLYAHYSAITSSTGLITAPGDFFFFSLVTAATVGYGDLVPQAGCGRQLVCLQIAASVVFLSVFISQAVGRAASPPCSQNGNA